MENLEDLYQDIIDYFKGRANFVQKDKIKNWINQNEENKQEFIRLSKLYSKVNFSTLWSDINTNNALHNIKSKTQNKIQFLSPISTIAASIIVILGVLLFLLQTKETFTYNTITKVENIKSNDVILMLSDGKKMILNDSINKIISEKRVDIENKITKEVVYSAKESDETKIKYNTLYIPKGGYYKLKLSDGTIVWINSDTRIKYPDVFPKKSREIYVDGEVYLKVAKNKKSPFIVHAKGIKTRVLGTEFNVMAYQNDTKVQITLVEGKVNVSNKENSKNILPNSQITVLNHKPNFIEKTVDTKYYTSWREGIFNFKETSLEELTVKLSRWYDVNFFFLNKEVKDYKYTGAIKKNVKLKFMLEFLEKTSNLKIEYKDKSILIYKK